MHLSRVVLTKSLKYSVISNSGPVRSVSQAVFDIIYFIVIVLATARCWFRREGINKIDFMQPNKLPVSYPGDDEFYDRLSAQFSSGEIDATDKVIRGSSKEQLGFTFAGNNEYSPSLMDEVISLSRELLEVLSLVAQTGKRLISCVIDGEFVEVKVEILGLKKGAPEEVTESTRRQVNFTISRDSSRRAQWTRGGLRSKSKTETKTMSLNKRSPHFSDGKEEKKRDRRMGHRVLEKARTEEGHMKYNINSKGPIFEFLKEFREAYLAVARAKGWFGNKA